MRHLALIAISLVIPLAGCRSQVPASSPSAEARRATMQKVRAGMSQSEVNAILGSPVESRPGNGTKDDVSIYKAGDGKLTIYFFHGRLTRVVSSREPVNR